jgi:hypothetical protein
VGLILLQQQARRWLALPAKKGDHRFQIDGPIELQLAEEGLERFETVHSRFDGRLFWYERRDPARDPSISAYLRKQFSSLGEQELPP